MAWTEFPIKVYRLILRYGIHGCWSVVIGGLWVNSPCPIMDGDFCFKGVFEMYENVSPNFSVQDEKKIENFEFVIALR